MLVSSKGGVDTSSAEVGETVLSGRVRTGTGDVSLVEICLAGVGVWLPRRKQPGVFTLLAVILTGCSVPDLGFLAPWRGRVMMADDVVFLIQIALPTWRGGCKS